jgi:subtilisin family serine protease
LSHTFQFRFRISRCTLQEGPLLRRTLAGLAAGALAAAGLAALPTSAGAAPDPEVVPGSYIVTLRSGDPDQVAKEHGNKYGASVDHVYRSALRGYAAHFSERSAARVADDPQVASVVADRVVRLDAKPPSGGGGGGSPSQTLPTGINRIDGELSSTQSGNGSGAVDVGVAVIDTGSGPHPDLNIAGGVNCSSGTSYNDGNGHGTHVAGTIGAKDDGVGVVGVAPGTPIYSVRVLNNQGSGSWASIICGIDWVTARASSIKVANMSLGGTGSDSRCDDGGMHQAICASVGAGITYAVAAGNESDNAANHVPAAYDEVITVSALADFNGLPGGGGGATCRSDIDDTFADFSNYGADVDLIAPGVCIRSTWKGGGYNTISGTSMATPHVTGAAALYLSGHSGASPAAVKSALQNAGTADWLRETDRDATHEPLLNVATF